MPRGFEKILKRTRRGINHEKDDEKKAAADDKDEDSKKDEDKKEAEADSDNEEEEKDKKKDKKTEEDDDSWKNRIFNFFNEPNGGGPNYDKLLGMLFLGGVAGYYYMFTQNPS